jgi:5-methylcytosine-specific restriction enzyme subunit McrC
MYSVIISLSKAFILNRTTSFSLGYKDAFCFLFPAEYLFEGFIAGVFKEMSRHKKSIRVQTNDMHLAEVWLDGKSKGRAFYLKEDILIKTENIMVVVDTKYKIIQEIAESQTDKKFGILDSDFHQIVLYALKRKALDVVLIYPLSYEERTSSIKLLYKLEFPNEQKFNVRVLKVPFVFSFENATAVEDLKNILMNNLPVETTNVFDIS